MDLGSYWIVTSLILAVSGCIATAAFLWLIWPPRAGE
jgi:hypothetical protein